MALKPESRIITDPSTVRNIPEQSARIAASVIFELYPGQVQEIGYETESFFHEPRPGVKEGTVPDLNVKFVNEQRVVREATDSNMKWCVQNLENVPEWLEYTDVFRNEKGNIDYVPILIKRDPKGRQKRVMECVAPDVDYGVWYRDDLTILRKVTKRMRKMRKYMSKLEKTESVA